ncbi:ubiquinol-cytochrome c reductase iron-sulfur subunit [Planctomicrobium sp. SH664]|uniref:QcrA and Rieske domain-containing protein n=1 Tax=Planctomicrobium sp. SH664 TaxID=3448125 RepID=UPI003F5AE1EE
MSDSKSSHSPSPPHHVPANLTPRRSFLMEALAVVIGGAITLIPGLAGAIFFLNPLLKRKKKADAEADDGFVMVGTVSALESGGIPSMFQVVGVKQDAWTTYPETALGAVYINQLPDGKLSCFNAKCPHLGCTVDYRPSENAYVCPCHDSSFNLEGERSNDIPPRNMDALDVQVRNERELWVRFQNFRPGMSKQEPV